ncbi:hypothetical protein [Streptomyces sp. NPDC088360]|uniref:hypothetical protein n=1 Tax=Streptomyces sp. NPDC088360 TaxID=3154515 RepID=UPI00344FA35F
MSRLYLGIDQSYSGCAIIAYSPGIDVFDEKLFDFSPDAAGTGVARLLHIQTALGQHFTALRDSGTVERVCLEGYAYGASFRREELGELGAVLRLALADAITPHRTHIVAPSTVKKFATGSGRSSKDKMMLEVYKRFGYDAPTHDAADAYTLARIAHALTAPPELKFQAEVVDTVLHPKTPRTKKAA